MSSLALYVCSVYENGKSHAACHASYQKQEVFNTHTAPDMEWRQGRSIGPLLGITLWGVKEAVHLGFNDVAIYYAFDGVEKWVTGGWRANKVYTQKYQEKMREWQQNNVVFSFVRIQKDHPIYEQIQHICFVATKKVKPEFQDLLFHVDPFPPTPPKNALESPHLCPRCLDAGEFSKPIHLRSVDDRELVCPTCALHLPDHEKLSYDRWRDCTNPKCGAPSSLRARIILGDEHPNFALQCPFCFTTFVYQLLTPFWARLWVEKSESRVVDLHESILEELMWRIKEKYDEENDKKETVLKMF